MRQLLTTSMLVLTLWGCTRPDSAEPAAPLSPLEQPASIDALVPIEPVVIVPSVTTEPAPPPVRATLSLSSPGPRVRITDTAELTVRARVEHLQGTSNLSLLLTSPDGNAYAVGTWLVEGDGAPIERALTVPVRNTAIESHRLAGDWKAQLDLDGNRVDSIVVGME